MRAWPLLFLCACAPADAQRTFDVAWSEFQRSYALFDVKGVDWEALGDTHRPEPNATSDELFDAMTNLLQPLDDNHVQLFTPDRNPWSAGSLEGRERDERHPDVVESLVSNYDRVLPVLHSGEIDGFGYLWVGAIDGVPIDIATQWLRTAPETGLILDLRQNFGGYGFYAERLARLFVRSDHVYLRERRRNGPSLDDFEDWVDYRVRPGPQRYAGPVVVLTGSYTVSGAEHLLLMLDGEEHITRVGGVTAGAFGASVPKDLPNGWIVHVTVDDVRTPAGDSLEGIGVTPDVPVPIGLSDLEAGEDPVLAAAVEVLQGMP